MSFIGYFLFLITSTALNVFYLFFINKKVKILLFVINTLLFVILSLVLIEGILPSNERSWISDFYILFFHCVLFIINSIVVCFNKQMKIYKKILSVFCVIIFIITTYYFIKIPPIYDYDGALLEIDKSFKMPAPLVYFIINYCTCILALIIIINNRIIKD